MKKIMNNYLKKSFEAKAKIASRSASMKFKTERKIFCLEQYPSKTGLNIDLDWKFVYCA